MLYPLFLNEDCVSIVEFHSSKNFPGATWIRTVKLLLPAIIHFQRIPIKKMSETERSTNRGLFKLEHNHVVHWQSKPAVGVFIFVAQKDYSTPTYTHSKPSAHEGSSKSNNPNEGNEAENSEIITVQYNKKTAISSNNWIILHSIKCQTSKERR